MNQLTDSEGPEGLVVFRCGDRGYCCLEVLQAADFRGELAPLREALFGGFERAARAADLELEVAEAALDALTEPFRYERNLVSAEETENWLEERRLTLDDYEDYFLRQFWRAAPEDELEGAEPGDDEPDAEETRRLLAIELQMSGNLHPMALRLAWRVAALKAVDGATPSPEELEEIEAERRSFFERSATDPATIAAWLEQLGCDPEWFEELLRMEAAFRRRCAALFTREARERMLRTQRLELIRLDVEVIDLDSSDAAHEAYLCAVNDGMSFQELAEETRFPYSRGQVLVNRLDDDGRKKFLSAKPGEVLPPSEGPDVFQLCRVLDKIEPSVDDEEIRERVDDLLVSAHFAELAGRRVRWIFDVDGSG